jgi:hypothetical protein
MRAARAASLAKWRRPFELEEVEEVEDGDRRINAIKNIAIYAITKRVRGQKTLKKHKNNSNQAFYPSTAHQQPTYRWVNPACS